MFNAGDFAGTETVMIPFNTFTSDDPSASVTTTNLANTDVYIYKDASLTQRTSASGIAVDVDVDGITGCHWITIDLTDNTDAGFYASGSQYIVRLEGITVDVATLNPWIGGFTIGKTQAAMTAALVAHNLDHLCLTATAAADMTTEVADNTILSRMLANGDTSAFVPSTDGLQPIRDHIGDGTNLTEAGGDGDHLTEAGGTGDQLTAINLPNQTMDITGNITGNLSGSVGSVTGAVGSVTGAVGSVTGAVGSVTGAVGSVTGNVGGNVVGTVASVVGAVGSVTGNVGGNVTGTVGELAAQAKTDVNAEVVDALATDTYAQPGQGTPAATASIATKISDMHKTWRNKHDSDGTTEQYYNDDASTVDQKRTVSAAAGTVTKGEIVTGP